jgi:hypothetical protein
MFKGKTPNNYMYVFIIILPTEHREKNMRLLWIVLSSFGSVRYCFTYNGGFCDASTKRPLPVLILPFKTSLNDFIPDNHEFQVKITLVYINPKFRFPEKFPICVKQY